MIIREKFKVRKPLYTAPIIVLDTTAGGKSSCHQVNHQVNQIIAKQAALKELHFVDVTLFCGDRKVEAHK